MSPEVSIGGLTWMMTGGTTSFRKPAYGNYDELWKNMETREHDWNILKNIVT